MNGAQSRAIAGVNGVYVVVSPEGRIYYVDGQEGGFVHAGALPSDAGPFTVACSASAGVESCVIAGANGRIWRGPARPTGGKSFREVTKG
jgi:hypothetical protein